VEKMARARSVELRAAFLYLPNYQITHLANCPDWLKCPEWIEVIELCKIVRGM
jgi:hypothetical protein